MDSPPQPLDNQIKDLKTEMREAISKKMSTRKNSDVETNLTSEQQMRNHKMFERRMSINVAYWKQKELLNVQKVRS